MAGSYRLLCRRRLRGWGSPPVLAMTVMTAVSLGVREDAGVELELLEDGPECQRREEGQGTDDQMVPISSAVNSGVSVGKVPAPAGTIFFLASEPARASTGITKMIRPSHMAAARVVL